MGWLSSVLLVVGLFCIVATLIPLVRRDAWWVRIFDYPRLQIAVLGLGTLVVWLAMVPPGQRWMQGVAVALGLALVYQAWMMWPYTPVAPKQVQRAQNVLPERTISVMVANVLMENRKASALLELVESYQPDLLLTIETDDWWEQQLRTLEADYAHVLKQPQDDTYGMLLYSRLPLHHAQITFLVEDHIPSMHVQVELPLGDRVSFHGLHPDPPNPRYATETTERDAELLVVGRSIAQQDRPTIIAGDFNDVAWSYTTRLFQRISGLLDPRRGRGAYSTFHADYRWMRWPLDHIFHSTHFTLVDIKRGPAWGSDHLPIMICLTLTPDAPNEQEEPEATAEEEEQAREKIVAAGPNVTMLKLPN